MSLRIVLAVAAAMTAGGAGAPARPAPGEVVERVACRDDPAHTYALYLPSRYSHEGTWPLLIVMDPRGRALLPLERVREAAEEYGYIVMSSYDTRSDGPREPNAAALKALLPEAEQRFALDTSRVYLAGFSGTARAGWDFGLALHGHVAGLVGFGAGLPPGRRDVDGAAFAFFGGAGVADFNYQEVRLLDAKLDDAAIPHRVRFYPGGHAWPAAPVFREALAWLEVQAMRAGLRPAARPLLEVLHRERLEGARALEAGGEPFEALLRYQEMVEDFDALLPVVEAESRARALRKDRTVRRTRSRLNRVGAEEIAYQARFHDYLAGIRRAPSPPGPEGAAAELKIASLRRRAENDSDPVDALAARRMLETVFVYTSFYEPGRLLAEGDPARALAVVAIAAAVKPGHPQVCLSRARARAQMGDKEHALKALACSLASGLVSAAQVRSDPYLEPLRGEAGYRSLLEGPPGPGGGES